MEEKSKKDARVIILGGGIAGLINAFYAAERFNPEDVHIVAQDFSTKDLGLYYLHSNGNTHNLLNALGITTDKAVEVNGGIELQSGEIISFTNSHIDIQFYIDLVKAHVYKTRGISWDGSVRSMNYLLDVNYRRGTIQRCTTSVGKLHKVLKDNLLSRGVNFHVGEIEKINIEEKIINFSFNNNYYYLSCEAIISTIPLWCLLKLLSKTELRDYIESKTIYTKSIDTRIMHNSMGEFDFIYSPFLDTPWYRKSIKKEIITFEYATQINGTIRNEAGHLWRTKSDIIDTYEQYLNYQNIFLSGRAGRWISGTLIQNVICEAMTIADNLI